jgi:hypothetical protein
MRVSARARVLALVPAAALGVHQLRYELAFGHRSDHELAAQGHAYLASLAPVLVLLAALVAAELIFRFVRASRGRAAAAAKTGFLSLTAVVATTLVAIYAGQELLEGLLFDGHPGGLAGVFADGGWWSMPVAVGLGGGIALLLRGAEAALSAVARRRRRRPLRGPRVQVQPPQIVVPPLPPLAAAAPSRAPPPAIASR